MRTTLDLKKELLELAMKETGLKEKTAVIHKGLEEIIRTAAYRRLAESGGKDKNAESGRRRRS